MHWREIERGRGAADFAARRRKSTSRPFARSRGAGAFVQGFGWVLLLLFPIALLDQYEIFSLGEPSKQFSVLGAALVSLGGAGLGAGFAFGRAGGEQHEFLLHHVPEEAQAKSQAHELARSLDIPFQVNSSLQRT